MCTKLRLSPFIVLLLALLCFACVEDKEYSEATNMRPEVNRNAEIPSNANLAEDNEDKLGSLIKLPFEPEENVFREEPVPPVAGNSRVPGPTDRRLTVVLRFSEEDTAKLIESVTSDKAPFKTEIEAPPWFPAELIAKSTTTGNDQLNGTGYSAKSFTKSPWLNGSLIKVDDTNYFVLILQTS